MSSIPQVPLADDGYEIAMWDNPRHWPPEDEREWVDPSELWPDDDDIIADAMDFPEVSDADWLEFVQWRREHSAPKPTRLTDEDVIIATGCAG